MMPSRSFDPVPTFVQPRYVDMNAQLENARAQWARMAPRVPQMPAEPPAVAVPFAPRFPLTCSQSTAQSAQPAICSQC